jgi:hypothetical protein
MFIQPKIIQVLGKEVEVRRGTSDLAKWEGVEFTDNVRELAMKLGGYIPTPEDEGYYTNYKAKHATSI